MSMLRLCALLSGLLLAGGPAWAEADGPDFWRVTGVRADDVLNLHAEASARSPTIARIPHDATGLKNLGCTRLPSFGEWQRLTEAQRAQAARGRWCRVEHQGRTGWVAGRFLAEGAAPAAVTGAGRASTRVGAWSVRCTGRECSIEQGGIAAAKPTLLRIEPALGGNARVTIERPGLPRTGALTIYMDGEQVAGGPIAVLRSKSGSRLVMEPDDITLGLLRNMERHKNMVLSFPGEDRGVEIHLEDFAKARQEATRLGGAKP